MSICLIKKKDNDVQRDRRLQVIIVMLGIKLEIASFSKSENFKCIVLKHQAITCRFCLSIDSPLKHMRMYGAIEYTDRVSADG